VIHRQEVKTDASFTRLLQYCIYDTASFYARLRVIHLLIEPIFQYSNIPVFQSDYDTMDLHNDLEIHHSLCIFIIILSPITYFLLTRKVIAPFGKHTSSIENKSINWGPCINPKLAWFIFESPNLLWSIYAFFHRKEYIFDNIANVTLFSLFSIHYVQRCIIYPMRMNESATLVNLAIMSSAFIFCCINGL
jgi:hypothetical protein